MNKEELLASYKQNLLTFYNKGKEFGKNKELKEAWNNEQIKLASEIQKLSGEDLKYFNDNYMEWHATEFKGLIEDVLKKAGEDIDIDNK